MPGFEYGLKRSFLEVIGGIILSAIMVNFEKTGVIPSGFILLFTLINLIGTNLLVFALPYWATTYSLGWAIGSWLMFSSGLVGIMDMLVYMVPLVIAAFRILKGIEVGADD